MYVLDKPQNVQPISKMRSFLEGAIPRLEQTTGVKISQAYRNNILASPTVALSSEMPSMVFNYLKSSQKGKEVELARKIQDLLYDQGLNTNNIDTYDSLIQDYGMDLSIKKEITSEQNRQATYSMFQQSKAMGVSGYPALLVEVDDQLYSLSSGYLPEQNLKAKLDQVLQMFAE